jgi:hypothetical protein
VSGEASWTAWTAARRIAATARAAAAAPPPGAGDDRARPERRPLPLGWAFALFVAALGYLWASRR